MFFFWRKEVVKSPKTCRVKSEYKVRIESLDYPVDAACVTEMTNGNKKCDRI